MLPNIWHPPPAPGGPPVLQNPQTPHAGHVKQHPCPLGGEGMAEWIPRAAELSWLKTCGGPQYWAARPACMVHHLPPQQPRYKAQEQRSQMRHQWARETPEEGNGCHAKLPHTIALRGPPSPIHATTRFFRPSYRNSGSNVGVGARNGGVCAEKFLPTALLLCLTRQRSPQPPPLTLPGPPMHATQSGLHSTARMRRWDGGSAQQRPQNHPKTRWDMGKWLPLPAHSKPRPTKHTIWCDCECGF